MLIVSSCSLKIKDSVISTIYELFLASTNFPLILAQGLHALRATIQPGPEANHNKGGSIMAKTKAKAKTTKAKTATPVKAKAASAKTKASAKAKTAAPKPEPFSEEWLKMQAHHGKREGVKRVVDKVLDRPTENKEPVALLARVVNHFKKKHGKKIRFTTADNIKGTIFRVRHEDLPGREIRLITYDNQTYRGKIGVGKPVFAGSKTKTGGAALKKQKLAGLIPQKNKPDKYWWFDANKKNEEAIIRFMKEAGF